MRIGTSTLIAPTLPLGRRRRITKVIIPSGDYQLSPRQIFGSDLVAWYDPSDAATITQSSSLVSQLNDKSGHGYHLTAAGGARPTYSATGIMQKPGLSFDGTDDSMSVAGVTVGTNQFSAFAVAEFPTRIGTGDDNFVGLLTYVKNGGTSNINSGSAAFIRTTATNHHATGRLATVYGGNTATLPVFKTLGVGLVIHGPVHRFGSVWDASNHTIYMDNVAADAVANTGPDLVSPGTLTLGGIDTGSGTNPWKGYVGEVVLVGRAVTAPERVKLDNWFMRQWGRILVCEGDSLVADGPYVIDTISNGGYAYRSVPNLNAPTYLGNYAIGGSDLNANVTVVSLVVREVDHYIQQHLPVNKYGARYWLYVGLTNNIATGTATQYTNNLADYLAARKAEGFSKVGTNTVTSRTDGQWTDAQRNAVNAILQTPGWKESKGIDFIVDLAADPIIGIDAAPTVNPTYFDGAVHLSPTGNQRAEAIFTATINAL